MRKQAKKREEAVLYGNCKAQFLRQIFEETQVDPKTGALNIKKGEAISKTCFLFTEIHNFHSILIDFIESTE
jgi:hypothetical protein